MKDFSDALEYAHIKLENKLKKKINLKLKELEKIKKEA